jgi:hypothetical protein
VGLHSICRGLDLRDWGSDSSWEWQDGQKMDSQRIRGGVEGSLVPRSI